MVDDREIRVLKAEEPAALPWEDLGVEVVIESTGKFRTRAQAAGHLEAGARKVILSAPAKGEEPPDATVVLGVNFETDYDPERHHIISNASCTTNCLAPVAKVVHEAVGIRHGLMTTIHAYTADQNLLDGPHKDLRRARVGGHQPGADVHRRRQGAGIGDPGAGGRLHGYAVRVPIPTGSSVDLSIEAERATSVEEINAALRARADAGELEGILAYTRGPDRLGRHRQVALLVDLRRGLTSVMDDTQVKVVAWYDNEWGYAMRLVELAERVLVPVPRPDRAGAGSVAPGALRGRPAPGPAHRRTEVHDARSSSTSSAKAATIRSGSGISPASTIKPTVTSPL